MIQMLTGLAFVISTVLLPSSFAADASKDSAPAKTIVILGDSLTEGYGLAKEKAFPALLEKKIQTSGRQWTVVNSGISGSTSASGPSRLNWILKKPPQILVLALGANDGLRGLDIAGTKKNLARVIETAKSKKVAVVLCGMMLPPNYGADYRSRFEKMYHELAKEYEVTFIPFLLKGVAGESSLNLADGIHPNEKGHEIVAQTVFEGVKKLL